MVLVFPFLDPVATFNPGETRNVPEHKPKFKISRTCTETKVRIELPDISNDNIFVDVTGAKLMILAKKYKEGGSVSSPSKKDKALMYVYKLEASLGKMVSKGDISAEQSDDVLCVLVPMNEEQPLNRRNDVKVSSPPTPTDE